MKKTYSILFIFLFSVSVTAQSNMLIEQLAGKLVTRENYNKNGKLISKQSFQVGEIKILSDFFEIEMLTKLYDANEKLIDEYKTYYKCKPNDSSLVVMILPFFNSKSKKTMVSSKSVNFKELYDLKNLNNIEIEISFDSGALNFFGSKSIIKICDRTLLSNKESKVIKSKLDIKAYAFGIRVKKFEYLVIEKLTNDGQLLFQKFTEEDGSYFTMTYKSFI